MCTYPNYLMIKKFEHIYVFFNRTRNQGISLSDSTVLQMIHSWTFLSTYSPLPSLSVCSQTSVTWWFSPRPWWSPCHGRLPRTASRTATNEKSDSKPWSAARDPCWCHSAVRSCLSDQFSLSLLSLISPPRCRGKALRRCSGGRSGAFAAAASGRVPPWRRAWGETGGAGRPLNTCKGSVYTPWPVSHSCCLLSLSWTLVSHFPEEEKTKEEQTDSSPDDIILWTLQTFCFFFFERALGDPYQVDVTQLVQPEVVDGSCNCWEVVRFECSITQTNSCAQSGQNPPVWYALLSAQLSRRKRKEMKSVHLPSLLCLPVC